MKNIMNNYKVFLMSLMAIAIFASCDEENGRVTWEGEYVEFNAATSSANYLRENDGNAVTDELQVNLVSAQKSEAVTVNVEIDTDNTTAIAGVHYNDVSGGTVTIDANSNISGVPIEILDDNIEPGETWVVVYNITGGSVEVGPNSTLTHSFGISCPSDLSGDWAFTTTDMARGGAPFPGTTTGTITLTETTTNGVYTLTDASFGQFGFAWGDSPAAGPGWTEVCDVLAYDAATDQYGDTYSLSNVSVSTDGTELTFDWVNTFSDGGTTTLVNPDGWPAGLTD